MPRALLSLLVLLLVTTAVVQARPFRDPQKRFTITYEDGWEVKTSGIQGAVVAFLHPTVVDGFHANLNVLVQDVGRMTAAQYAELNRREILQMKGRILSPFTSNGSGGNGIWKATLQGKPLQFYSYYVIARGKCYLVTGTALQKNFSKYLPSFRRMASTLKVS